MLENLADYVRRTEQADDLLVGCRHEHRATVRPTGVGNVLGKATRIPDDWARFPQERRRREHALPGRQLKRRDRAATVRVGEDHLHRMSGVSVVMWGG